MAYTQQPVPIQVQTIDPSQANNPDSAVVNLIGGRASELLQAELHGKYYTQTYRGNMFSLATVAAGRAIPVESTTAPTFGIWNPLGSGKNAVLVCATYGFVGTTSVPGNIGLTVATAVGAQVVAAGPISAFVVATPNNMLIGSGKTSAMKCTNSGTTTLAAAGTILGTSGMSSLTNTGASTVAPMWTLREDFDGQVIIAPGSFLYPTTSSSAMATSFGIRWIWYETLI